MQLVIHCGCHKTATTTFQMQCASIRQALKSCGILYPEYKNKIQHSYILWAAVREGWHIFDEYLCSVRLAASLNCHTVFLSGEDFENAIIDINLARRIEKSANLAGFTSVTWIVVFRDQESYTNSIYAEMSKQGVVLCFDILKKAAQERGCFYVSSENFDYIFALDYHRFSDNFKNGVLGKVLEISMAEFTKDVVGLPLFKVFLRSDSELDLILRQIRSVNISKLNVSRSTKDVEFAYIANMMGKTNWWYARKWSRLRRLALWPIIAIRLDIRRRTARFYK